MHVQTVLRSEVFSTHVTEMGAPSSVLHAQLAQLPGFRLFAARRRRSRDKTWASAEGIHVL